MDSKPASLKTRTQPGDKKRRGELQELATEKGKDFNTGRREEQRLSAVSGTLTD